MGLDMYLSCNSKRLTDEVFEAQDAAGYQATSDWEKPHGIIGYWRKDNAIHQWFVDNVQSGEDDCHSYEVSPEQLAKLKEACDDVLEASTLVPGKVVNYIDIDHDGKRVTHYTDGNVIEDDSVAKRLLPTQEGFFFGGTQYDEWYLKGVRYTSWLLGEVLSRVKPYESDDAFAYGWVVIGEDDWCVEFRYQSSW